MQSQDEQQYTVMSRAGLLGHRISGTVLAPLFPPPDSSTSGGKTLRSLSRQTNDLRPLGNQCTPCLALLSGTVQTTTQTRNTLAAVLVPAPGMLMCKGMQVSTALQEYLLSVIPQRTSRRSFETVCKRHTQDHVSANSTLEHIQKACSAAMQQCISAPEQC